MLLNFRPTFGNLTRSLYTLALIVGSQQLAASPIDSTGLSSRAISLGNALTAGGDPATAAYYNPASLTESKDLTLTFNYLYTNYQLNDLAVDPQVGPSGLTPDSFRASKAPDSHGVGFGLNLPLIQGLHFGFAGYLPTSQVAKITGQSKRHATYVRYAQRSARPLFFTALGKEVGYGFSLGVGLTYTLQAKQNIQLALSKEDSDSRFQLEMEPVISPYAGIYWQHAKQNEHLRFGIVYRQGQAAPSSLNADLAIDLGPGSLPVNLNSELVPFFDPSVWSFGASWKKHATTLFLDLSQTLWSQYEPPIIELKGKDIATLTDDSFENTDTLKDAASLKFGVEQEIAASRKSQIALRLGIEHHQSAARNQNAILIDVDRTVLSLGTGILTPIKTQGIERKASISLTLQNSLLKENSFTTVDEQKAKAGGSAFTLVGGFEYDL